MSRQRPLAMHNARSLTRLQMGPIPLENPSELQLQISDLRPLISDFRSPSSVLRPLISDLRSLTSDPLPLPLSCCLELRGIGGDPIRDAHGDVSAIIRRADLPGLGII